MRAYTDLLAYGRHFDTCRIRETVHRHGHRPALHPHQCSCGFTKALEDALAATRSQEAASPQPAEDARA